MILVSRGSQGIHKVMATGGTLAAATVLASGDRAHRAPVFLPDGIHFLYVARLAGTGGLELRVGSLESKEMVESLGPVESSAVYAGGYLFFVRGGHMSGGNLTTWASISIAAARSASRSASAFQRQSTPLLSTQRFPSRQRRIGWCTCPGQPCST